MELSNVSKKIWRTTLFDSPGCYSDSCQVKGSPEEVKGEMLEKFPYPFVTVTTPPCFDCGEPSKIEVDSNAYRYWKNGELLIQDAFPGMSAPQRELLKSGTHPSCWERMFAEMEESIED